MRFPRVLGVMALGLLALGGEARADDKADAAVPAESDKPQVG